MTMGQFPQHHYGFFDHNLLPHFNHNYTTDHHNFTTDTHNIQVNFHHNYLTRFYFNPLTK